MSYEVRMSDSVVNTGLDCQFFASESEAQEAADVVNIEYPNAHAEVFSSNEDPTIDFATWHAQPWG